MYVIKRDNSEDKLNIDQIRKQTIPACKGLSIEPEEIEINAKISFTTGIKTSDIQKLLIQSALGLTTEFKSDAQIAAGRLHLYDMYHRIKRNMFGEKRSGDVYELITFKDYVEFNKERLSWCDNDFYRNVNFSKFDLDMLNKHIQKDRDCDYTYLAIESLEERYLLTKNNIVSELPQHLFMSLACFAAQNEEDANGWAIKFYNMMSNKEFHPGTPIISNGRTIKKVKDKVMLGNCFSCAVGSMPDDIIGIFDSYKKIALGSKFGSGWGYDVTRIRALGGTIQDIKGVANGSVPWMKLLNDLAIAVDQLGTRKGAINASMESWDLDIDDFINMKSNAGEDKRTTKELFISMTVSDIYMERVESNASFTLFDPHDVPELTELHGEMFAKRYLELEKMAIENPEYFTNKPKVIDAKKLWKKFQNMAYETGNPFLTFKDTVNKDKEDEYDYSDVGIIRSANLCVTGDTKLYTKEYGHKEIGVMVESGIKEVTAWNGVEWSKTSIFRTDEGNGQHVLIVTIDRIGSGSKHPESVLETITIHATDYHKWYVKSSGSLKVTELRTSELKPGLILEGNGLDDYCYKIKNVKDESITARTYCGTEPKRNKLIFNGVLTGNCQEYLAAIKDDEITLCDLGSINIAKVKNNEHLKELVYNAHRFLDNVIDVTAYPIPTSEETQKERRSVGLGLAGEAEYLANHGIVYGTTAHGEWIDEFYSKFQEYSDQASLELGKERGACKYSKKGYRNLYRRAIAPTSSISILMGTSTSVEAVFDRVWVEDNILGNIKITAPGLNESNYLNYVSAYDVDQVAGAKLMGKRQQYIDMGISYTLYYRPETTTGKLVFDTYMEAWKSGVKTIYYVRSKSRKKLKDTTRDREGEIACFGCGG